MKASNPRDILRYQMKGLLNIAGKRAVFFVVGLLLFFGVGLLLAFCTPLKGAGFLVALLVAAPFLASAVLQVSGLYFNQIMVRLFNNVILHRDYRPYRPEDKR